MSDSGNEGMEEDDLLQHNGRRKRKDGEGGFSLEEQDGRKFESVGQPSPMGPSFRDMLVNGSPNNETVIADTVEVNDEESYELSDGEEDEEDEKCPNIKLTKIEKSRYCKPWKNSLIIKLIGRSIGYAYLSRRVKELWKPKSPIDLIALDNDFFLARFNSREDFDFALEGGPWIIADHYLSVRQWCPDFDPFNVSLERLAVWVRFPCLPIEYFNEDFLMRLGRKIGDPIRVDNNTSRVTRGHFARLCVEVDVTKPLLSKFKLNRRVRRIEYEALHMVCFSCGIFGHMKDNCPSLRKELQPENVENVPNSVHSNPAPKVAQLPENQVVNPAVLDDFGDWMLVKKDRRRNQRPQEKPVFKFGSGDHGPRESNKGKSTMKANNNPFSSLVILQDSETHIEHNATPPVVQDFRPVLGKKKLRDSKGKGQVVSTVTREETPNIALDSYVRSNGPAVQSSVLKIRGVSSGSGGSSRKAAAQDDHVVVQGNNRTNQSKTWVVSNPKLVGLANLETELDRNQHDNFNDPSFPHPTRPNIPAANGDGNQDMNLDDDAMIIVAQTSLNEFQNSGLIGKMPSNEGSY